MNFFPGSQSKIEHWCSIFSNEPPSKGNLPRERRNKAETEVDGEKGNENGLENILENDSKNLCESDQVLIVSHKTLRFFSFFILKKENYFDKGEKNLNILDLEKFKLRFDFVGLSNKR